MGAVVLDANILIALVDPKDAHHAVVRSALEDARSEDAPFVLPVSAYSELLVGPSKKGEDAVRTIERLVDELTRVVPISRGIGREAARLRAKHGRRLRLPEALIVATAVVEEGSVLTTDAEWPEMDVSVRVVAPRR